VLSLDLDCLNHAAKSLQPCYLKNNIIFTFPVTSQCLDSVFVFRNQQKLLFTSVTMTGSHQGRIKGLAIRALPGAPTYKGQ
jgi:hypothetical protein